MSTPQGFQQGGLNGYYFKDIHSKPSWGSAAAQTVDSQINFNWGYGGAAAGAVGNDNFAGFWKGKIQAIRTGWTNFFTTSDDGVMLKVNGQQVINQWRDQSATEFSGGIYLEAGKFYDVDIHYYERGGNAVMQLAWDSAGSKQIVSANNLFYDIGVAAAAGVLPNRATTSVSQPIDNNPINFKSVSEQRFGFVTSVTSPDMSQYYAAGTVKAIDFNFGNGAPVANMPIDNFVVNSSGRMSVQSTGWYNFFVTADDSVNVQIGDTKIASNSSARGTTTYQSGMWMEAGKSYHFTANYQDLGGTSNFKIEWQGNDTNWGRTTLTDRNILTLSDRMPVNVYSSNMFTAYDQTGGGEMSKLRQLYPNQFWF
jgi:hypothetical protein